MSAAGSRSSRERWRGAARGRRRRAHIERKMEPRPVLLALLTAPMAALAYAPPTKFDNMNGAYRLSKTPRAPGEFPGTAIADFPGGVEYFEMYVGPFTSLYSQVWWAALPEVQLPDDIKKRFNDSAMAIIGYEVDQVRRKGDKDFDGSILEEDVSVPINAAYNHHHDTAVVGSGTHLEEVSRDEAMASHGREYIRLSHNRAWVPVEHAPAPDGLPTSAMFSDGNGGEYRKSYHAYAPPYVQLVHSPVALAGSVAALRVSVLYTTRHAAVRQHGVVTTRYSVAHVTELVAVGYAKNNPRTRAPLPVLVPRHSVWTTWVSAAINAARPHRAGR